MPALGSREECQNGVFFLLEMQEEEPERGCLYPITTMWLALGFGFGFGFGVGMLLQCLFFVSVFAGSKANGRRQLSRFVATTEAR